MSARSSQGVQYAIFFFGKKISTARISCPLRAQIPRTSKIRNFTNMIATDMILSDSESPCSTLTEYITYTDLYRTDADLKLKNTEQSPFWTFLVAHFGKPISFN